MLKALGARENGTIQLEEAVAAWNACLTVTTSLCHPSGVDPSNPIRDVTQPEIAQRPAARTWRQPNAICPI